MRRAIKSATRADQAYQDAARALGCVVCLRMKWAQPNETHIHHRNIGDLHGQKQIGQHAVVALCAYHHEGVPIPPHQTDGMREIYGPSFKSHARDFRVWTQDVLPGYGRGTEAWQNYQDELLGECDD
jgi:RecA-dependent nuclease